MRRDEPIFEPITKPQEMSDDALASVVYRISHNFTPTHQNYEVLREAARRLCQ
jgi:hypothetical protein